MKVFRYIGVRRHRAFPRMGDESFQMGDTLVLIDRVDGGGVIMLSNGAVRGLRYEFWKSSDFVEICP